jgi:beta-mannosidase
MARVFAEWRRTRSVTRGGLVWFLRDLWAGAGWGIIDADGVPKAAWHYLRRAWAPLALSITDEGGNGLAIHAVNDQGTSVSGSVDVALYRAGEIEVRRGIRAVTIPPRSGFELNANAFFDDCLDLGYAYRFGPPGHDLVVATLRDGGGGYVAQAFHFVLGLPSTRERDVGLSARAHPATEENWELVVGTRRFAQSVALEIEGFSADDDYFHLAPSSERRIILRRSDRAGPRAPRGGVRALNAEAPATIQLAS